MPTQHLSLNVPGPIYEHLKQRAEQAQRSVEEESLEVLATVVPADTGLPAVLREAIESLSLLDDAALWRAARSRLPDDVIDELESLQLKLQREGLTDTESGQLSQLVYQYERQMLVRAQAAALLKQRGHNVSELIVP
jgi:plasmid stability protein